MKYLWLFILMLSVSCFAQLTPTTTLTAETANNTSAATSFLGTSNGNLGAGNISKVNVHTLLPAGSTAKVIAHMVPWWGNSSHIQIGYSSVDPLQAERTINDMVSRGVDGITIDWYGKGSHEDKAALLLKSAAEQHPGFEFSIFIDKGTIDRTSCYKLHTCSATQALLDAVTYARATYFASPAYSRRRDLPLMGEFGLSVFNIDWTAVQMAYPEILWVHRNNGGFTVPASSGAYAWLATRTSDWVGYESIPYLTSFYATAVKYPSKLTWGSTFRGFNDTIASWGKNRHVDPMCGKTWLDTWAKVPLTADTVQLVTWDDYEEGSELETGVDNCVGVSGTVQGGQVGWTVIGDAATLDHFELFLSTDGENLAKIGDLPVVQLSYDLKPLNLPVGTYQVFLKSVGKPFIINQTVPVGTYTVEPPPPPPVLLPPVVTVVTPLPDFSTTRQGCSTKASAVSERGAISSFAIYLNSVLYTKISTLGPIDVWVNLPVGKSKITVKAWDKTGASGMTSVYVTRKQ